MTNKNKQKIIRELKVELKRRAAEIRAVRRAEKEYQRDATKGWTGPREYELLWYSTSQFRHMLIAYCLLRGRTYEQIEPKIHAGNEPHWDIIEKIKERGASVYNYTPVIWTLDGKTWIHKSEINRHHWDQQYADLHAVREQVTKIGCTRFGDVSLGQFQKLQDLMRKVFGGK